MLLPRNHHLQMSSCLGGGGGGGGRAYAFELEILKSPSPSPSSTLSESSNSGLSIATRKPRTPRKRPNQIYNEAAALLSTLYPKVFSAATVAAANSRILSKSPFSSSSSSSSSLSDDSSELFFPFRIVDDDSTFLISEKPSTVRAIERSKFSNSSNSSSTLSEKSCPSPGEFDSREVNFRPRPMDLDCEEAAEDDFDYAAESILDEEVDDGGGIDSIMGNLTVESTDDRTMTENTGNTCYGYPMGLGLALGFELGFGIQRGGFVRALRHGYDANYGDNNWWSFPTVDMGELSPRFRKPSEKKAKKKMKKVAAVVEREKAKAKAAEEHHAAAAAVSGACEPKSLELPETTGAGLGLLLKLNYDGVLRAWSDKGSPFSDDGDAPVGSQNDVAARLAQIDLFPETGGVREASVLRYKEKRRTRLFSKKIRYQVRKVNADRRPRMKGRFVRRPNSKHE